VLFEMGLDRLFSVTPAVNYVAPRCVSMMCSFLVSSGLMMLGCTRPNGLILMSVLRVHEPIPLRTIRK